MALEYQDRVGSWMFYYSKYIDVLFYYNNNVYTLTSGCSASRVDWLATFWHLLGCLCSCWRCPCKWYSCMWDVASALRSECLKSTLKFLQEFAKELQRREYVRLQKLKRERQLRRAHTVPDENNSGSTGEIQVGTQNQENWASRRHVCM